MSSSRFRRAQLKAGPVLVCAGVTGPCAGFGQQIAADPPAPAPLTLSKPASGRPG